MVVVHNIFLKSPVRNLDYLLGVLYFLLMTTYVSRDGVTRHILCHFRILKFKSLAILATHNDTWMRHMQ